MDTHTKWRGQTTAVAKDSVRCWGEKTALAGAGHLRLHLHVLSSHIQRMSKRSSAATAVPVPYCTVVVVWCCALVVVVAGLCELSIRHPHASDVNRGVELCADAVIGGTG